MNNRKKAFQKGLRTITRPEARRVFRIRPSLYNAGGMPETNQIIQGDCIKLLNEGPKAGSTWSLPIPRSTSVICITATMTSERRGLSQIQRRLDARGPSGAQAQPARFIWRSATTTRPIFAVIARRKIGFNMRNWIIWHYTFGQQTKNEIRPQPHAYPVLHQGPEQVHL